MAFSLHNIRLVDAGRYYAKKRVHVNGKRLYPVSTNTTWTVIFDYGNVIDY